MAADLRRICSAPHADPAEAGRDAFEKKRAGTCAAIAPASRRAWAKAVPFPGFDPALRKIIRATNAMESLHRAIRTSLKTRDSFLAGAAATRLIWLTIRNFEKKGRNVTGWFAARNRFAIMFGARLDACLSETAWARPDTQSS